MQTMLAAIFIKYSSYTDTQLSELFAAARAQRPPSTNVLIFAALVEPDCRNLLRHSTPTDWRLWFRGLIRRPNVLYRVLGSRRRNPDWWRILEFHTAARLMRCVSHDP